MNDFQYIFLNHWFAKTSYKNHNAHSKELINYIKNYTPKTKKIVAPHIKHNLIESDGSLSFFNTNEKVIINLKEYLENEIYNVFDTLMSSKGKSFKHCKAEIIESWYHITNNGGYHDIHSHSHTSFSGIYFISVKECGYKNGSIRFYTPFNGPRTDMGLNWLPPESIDFEPEDGDIIIFPGFLQHSAIPYFGKSERIVIAFNARII